MIQLHTLLATAGGRYDFTLENAQQSLNALFSEIQPIAFQDWFIRVWNL